jgi:hypothetical protein
MTVQLNKLARSVQGFGKLLALIAAAAVILVGLLFYREAAKRFVRESFMQSVTSTHYEILCPVGALTQAAMTDFATRREPLFTALDKKLGDAGSNSELRVIFDPAFPTPAFDSRIPLPYAVTGTTIRSRLVGDNPQLPSAADAEALLTVAWGKHGNPQIARWVALWLVGDWRGAEVGMAAAEAEQRLGHKNVATLLENPAAEIASPDDQALLGAAWISEIAEFGGAAAVRKVYAAKMNRPNVAAITQALGSTQMELDRKWQMWMYSYLAGMPAAAHGSEMQMRMPMGR